MKSVLISIKPKWCEKIARGEKTIEVRKTAPKETPFKAYIYETKGATETPWVDEDGHFIYKGRGQVIGEFICDYVEDFTPSEYGIRFKRFTALHETCLTVAEMREYANGKPLYGWHISDLKIYDKPKELSEFINPCSRVKCISGCKDMKIEHAECLNKNKRHITRPPQSWQYLY